MVTLVLTPSQYYHIRYALAQLEFNADAILNIPEGLEIHQETVALVNAKRKETLQ